MKKLIQMTDFVLEQLQSKQSTSEFKEIVKNYANFLKQPLTVGMFVPCKLVDGVWVVLVSPDFNDDLQIQDVNLFNERKKEYKQAKERCLFEGYSVFKRKDYYVLILNEIPTYEVWVSWNESKTVEDLINSQPTLTPTAIKQLGL